MSQIASENDFKAPAFPKLNLALAILIFGVFYCGSIIGNFVFWNSDVSKFCTEFFPSTLLRTVPLVFIAFFVVFYSSVLLRIVAGKFFMIGNSDVILTLASIGQSAGLFSAGLVMNNWQCIYFGLVSFAISFGMYFGFMRGRKTLGSVQ